MEKGKLGKYLPFSLDMIFFLEIFKLKNKGKEYIEYLYLWAFPDFIESCFIYDIGCLCNNLLSKHEKYMPQIMHDWEKTSASGNS